MPHPRLMSTSIRPIAALVIVAVLGAQPGARLQERSGAPGVVAIPFELAGRHIIVKVTVGSSRPLSFVFDTGAHAAIIRLEVAKELGLRLEGEARTGGAGPGTQIGSQVRGARWSLVGLSGVAQPLTLALPLPEPSPAAGRPLDGIIGGEFIREFVVELDYQAKGFRLHKPESFRYTGSGESIPIDFVNVSHPTVAATVTPVGGQALERRFMLDVGSGLALALHSPFVDEQNLLGPDSKTIRAIGGAGAGGRVTGRLGRVESLQIGSFTIGRPITMFAQDKAGAFANAALAGNIGAQIAMRFRLYLDYGRRRIILEPSPRFSEPFDRAFSGLAMRAYGPDYRTFRVTDVLEDSPATEADIRQEDVITAVNDIPASQLTLATILAMFERPATYTLTIRRDQRTFTVSLTPRRLI
ncbi:MAG TPA: aspartyl protease family protein [Vicinamibacterales bacterium]